MSTGKSIRIYLADGNVSGIRHGEIVNWTGQALACPRLRFSQLKEWPEAKKPGVYFLIGQNEDSGEDSVYIGEAEVVFDRLSTHITGKDFWTEVITFTSKDDNLTKSHVKYLESRLIEMANKAGRYQILNSVIPQLSSLPRSDRDAMEQFIDGVQSLLGVLGHKVLEPLIQRNTFNPVYNSIVKSADDVFLDKAQTVDPQTFYLKVSSLVARAVRTDEGFVVLKNSDAALVAKPSLTGGSLVMRTRLYESGVLVLNGSKYMFARDQLFRSSSQAAGMVVGYSINGRDNWKNSDGISLSEIEYRLANNQMLGT